MPTHTLSELRTASRALARTPTVTIAAVLCLTLGIGATTAISSAVSRALLDPLPFRDADRLVAVHRVTPHSGPLGRWPQSPPNYVDLARETRQLEALAAAAQGSALVTLTGEAMQVSRLIVSGNFFATLGAAAYRGRLLMPDDARAGAPRAVVVSHDFWQTRLGGDSGAVGRSISMNGEPATVVGIATPEFRVPHGSSVLQADLYTALLLEGAVLTARRNNFLWMFGRLRASATIETAHAEMQMLFGNLVRQFPELNGEGLRVAPLHAENVGTVRTALLLLFGAVSLVLLIAVTNVAALLLARGVQRRREMAVRVALGATRWDAMRPALWESALIAALGALGGLALGAAAIKTIGSLAAARLPQLAGLHLDARVLAFALVLSAIVAVACGVAPAWRSAAVDPQDALRGGRGAGAGREHHRTLNTLVVAEISLSMVLLIGAGLVLRGFSSLLAMDPGFDPQRLLTLRVAAPGINYPDATGVQRFLEPALAAIRAIPGVEAASAISSLPYQSWGNNNNTRYEGQPGNDPTRLPIVEQRRVTPEFFGVTQQRLLAGRLLQASDADPVNAPLVVVVNEALARRDFPGAEAVGRRFHVNDTTFATIVGVVSDIRNAGPFAEPAPEMYWHYAQTQPGTTSFPVVIRTAAADPLSVAGAVRDAVRAIDPSAAVSDLRPMEEVIARSLGRPRFYLSLLASFAVVALLLAMAGLYGVLSYVVAQRAREIGIRAALGGSQRVLLRLVGSQGMRLVAIGLGAGMFGGYLATRLMTSMLYGVSPLDPRSWAAAAALMAAAGALAVLVPARRASRANPAVALRMD